MAMGIASIKVPEEMKASLVCAITVGEIQSALASIKRVVAPGLDGYNFAFFQVNWDVVGCDVV